MPLELATRLILREAADGSPLAEDRLRGIVAQWAGVTDAAAQTIEDVPGRTGGRIGTREVRLGEERCRWDLSMVRTDDDDATVQWRAEVTAVFDPDRTSLVVRLRRDSADHRLRPLTGSPAPPRVIRDVLRAEGIDCFDGPLRVQPRYRQLRSEEVDGFIDTQLVAEDRRLPILAVAKMAGPPELRLDIAKLTQGLAGFAHVLLLDRTALPKLGRELANLSLAQDSARLWWPGLELDDDSTVHPCWAGPYEDPTATVESIRRLVLTVSRDRWREPSRVVQFGRDLRHHRDEIGRTAASRVVEEIERLRTTAAADRARAEQAAAAADTAPSVDIDSYEQQLATVAGDLDAVREDLEHQRVAAEDAEGLWEEAEHQRARLEQQNRSLHGQLEGLKAQLRERTAADGAPPQTLDEQFDAEVKASWQQRLTPDDRKSHTLAPYVIRDGFIESIAKATADRQKVVDTAMEVACGRAKEIEGRQLHKLRASTGANSADRRRTSDGAVAWRCNVQRNSPSARRLHFWLCPGGSIEFVNVVTHDDFSISE